MSLTSTPVLRRPVTAVAAVIAALALILTGCSGDTAPSKDQLVSKLSTESDFSSIKTAVPADQYNSFVSCVADFLIKKGKSSDLNEYVSGKRSLNDVRGYTSESDAEQTGKQCAQQAGIGQSGSNPSSAPSS